LGSCSTKREGEKGWKSRFLFSGGREGKGGKKREEREEVLRFLLAVTKKGRTIRTPQREKRKRRDDIVYTLPPSKKEGG